MEIKDEVRDCILEELFSELVDKLAFISLDAILRKFQLSYKDAIGILNDLLKKLKSDALYLEKFSGLISKVIVNNDHNNPLKIINVSMTLEKKCIQVITEDEILIALIPSGFDERNYYLLMPLTKKADIKSNIDFICSRMVFPQLGSSQNSTCDKNKPPYANTLLSNTSKCKKTQLSSINCNYPPKIQLKSAKDICNDINENESWVKEVLCELSNENTMKRTENPNLVESVPNKLLKTDVVAYPALNAPDSIHHSITSVKKSSNIFHKNENKPSKQATLNLFFSKKQ